MLREAELLVRAEQLLVEVLGRIREQDRDLVLPPMFPGAERPVTMGQAVAQYVWQDALGYFRAPMPLPGHVSWRDRFLLRAGHQPHPLGH